MNIDNLTPCIHCGWVVKVMPFDIVDSAGEFAMHHATWRAGCTNPECGMIGPKGGRGSAGKLLAAKRYEHRIKASNGNQNN